MNSTQNGIISAVHVKEGSLVKQGDPIAEVNHEVLKAQLLVAREAAAKSETAIQIASREANRARADHDQARILKTASPQEISQARANEMRAEGELLMAQQEKKINLLKVDEIQTQIDQHILRSPMDGVVVELNRRVSESASVPQKAGEKEAAIVRIARLDKLRLVINIPLRYAGGLKGGDSLPVLILDKNSLDPNRGKSGSEVPGTIEFISPEANPASETVRTKVIIENEDGKYRSGTHAYALLPRGDDGFSFSE